MPLFLFPVTFPGAGGGSSVNIAVPFESIDLQGLTPTVSVSDNKNIAIPFAAMDLQGFVPVVLVSNHKNVTVPFASLDLQGFAPTASATNHKNVAVPFASMSLDAFTPTVSVSDFVQVVVVHPGHAGGVPKKKAKPARKTQQRKVYKVTYYKEVDSGPVAVFVPYAGTTLRVYPPVVNIEPSPALIRAKKAHTLALRALMGESGA